VGAGITGLPLVGDGHGLFGKMYKVMRVYIR
jgi:hypothetical protein